MAKIQWFTKKRKIKDLIPFDKNPRDMTDTEKRLLTDSLNKFDLAEIPAITTDNTIIAGHQRIKILTEQGREDEEIDVRVPNRKLTQREIEEYNLRSNKNTGHFVDEMLVEFEEDLLTEVGFDMTSLKEKEIKDLSDNLDRVFEVAIECDSEDEQKLIYDKLTSEGYKCRLLTL